MSSDGANADAMSNETPATNPNLSSKPMPLVDLKNGRVVFKQKPVSFEKQSETLQEIVKFREMLEVRIERQEPPLTSIPDAHRPLIAKLAHESDKTLAALSKHIRQELLPTQDEDHNSDMAFKVALPPNVVEAAIKSTVERRNYGLDVPGNTKVPATVCVWRWEVKEEHWEWLPKNGREKAETRQAERAQAKNDLKALFETLTETERDAILDPKGTGKTRDADGAAGDSGALIDLTSRGSTKSPTKMKASAGEDSTLAKVARAKKVADPEKMAKEKEKMMKKAAKAEKEKREQDARDKSRSLMANFFAKPKVTQVKSKDVEAVAGPSTITSEFERVFKPFVLKKDTELAPVNWFLTSKKHGKRPASHTGVIVIDDDDDGDIKPPGARASDVSNTKTIDTNANDLVAVQARLQSIITRLPHPTTPQNPSYRPHQTSTPHLKTSNPRSVRDIMTRLSEAEIAGDVPLVRKLLSTLRDREPFPIKVLIFRDDARPGYFGTWTRNSYIIGPRCPFAKDALVLDYSYDSGEEWEEEPPGEADDVVDDAEDEDGDEEADSDLDDWLVDDDEESDTVGDGLDPLQLPDLPPLTKRKSTDTGGSHIKRRKVVTPLVPFARGPCWESTIGECQQDLFNPYRIQLFNDTPFPINPFTFVSTCLEDKRASAKATSSGDKVFAVPSLPNRLNPAAPNLSGSPDLSNNIPDGQKKSAQTPKFPFPEAHIPFLLKKITTLGASSITLLVEAIFQDLRPYKVKKNAIVAKVREVGERCKVKKVWVVKPAFVA